jgi:tetratricopeptide (TPR) repeat protein
MLLSALLIASLTSAPAARSGPAASAAEIEGLTKAGKIDDAIDSGRAAVAARPDDVDTRLALARALGVKARRFNHVVNVKLSKDDVAKGTITVPGGSLDDGPLQIGYDAGMFEEAQLHLNEGIKRAPAREDVRVFQCYLLTDASRVDRAKAAIADAMAKLPKTPAAAKTFVAYGAERVKRGDIEGGAALMAPVAGAYPGDADVQSDYGNVLTRLGRKAEAFAALDRAVRAAPKNVRAARTRATAAMLLRDYPRAQSAWDDVHRLTRLDGDALASAAAAYAIDPKAAVPLFRDLATPSPSSNKGVADVANLFALAGTAGPRSDAAKGLAKGLIDSGQLVLAIPLLDSAVRADATDASSKGLLVKVFTDLGCEALAHTIK